MNIKEYQIAEKLAEKQIEQLIEFSNSDPEILANTRDAERFKDRKGFDVWISKPKKIFVLTNDDQDLLGIIWFPKSTLALDKRYGIGFAIRIYPPARGKGLSRSFTNEAIERLKQTDFYKNIPNKGIFLDSLIQNKKAHSLYEKLGFKEIGEKDGRIVMILDELTMQ